MKIRLLNTAKIAGKHWPPGTEGEVAEDLGRELIGAKAAEKVLVEPPVAPETLTDAAPEATSGVADGAEKALVEPLPVVETPKDVAAALEASDKADAFEQAPAEPPVAPPALKFKGKVVAAAS